MIKISPLTARQATAQTLKHISSLLFQLRGKESKVSLKELRAIAGDKNAEMLVIRDGTRVIGVATLYVMQKLGKKVSHVEDVVVDATYRGQGLGKKLMQAVIVEARRRKVKSVNLTSRPARVAANKLYKKLGFEPHQTNVYRLKL